MQNLPAMVWTFYAERLSTPGTARMAVSQWTNCLPPAPRLRHRQLDRGDPLQARPSPPIRLHHSPHASRHLIFRKRRHLLDHLFRTATDSLRDWFRLQLDLPGGKLAAIAGVQTFGDANRLKT
jgi:hypothetical protein